MPGEYRSAGGGLYGSGVFPDSRPRVDVGSLVDAVGSGTSSIIRAVMARKQAEFERQRERTAMEQHQQQIAIEQGRETREASHQAADLALRRQSERHRFLEAGGIPAAPGTPASDDTSQAGIAPISPIRQALAPGQIPPVQATPSNAPASSGNADVENANVAPAAAPMATTLHAPNLGTPATPESYDPTKAAAYIRTTAVADLRNQGLDTRQAHRQEFSQEMQNQRLDARKAGQEFAAQAAASRQQRALAAKAAGGAIPKAMTAGQQQAANERLALGFLQAHTGGTFDDALQTFTNTDEGKQLAAAGMTQNHLLAAYGKLKTDPTTGQILGLVNSGAAKNIPAAAATVDAAREAGAKLKKPSSSAPPTKSATPSTSTAPATEKPDARADAAAWRKTNRRNKGESDDDYYARYVKANPVKATP